jgi:hypothetical protein
MRWSEKKYSGQEISEVVLPNSINDVANKQSVGAMDSLASRPSYGDWLHDCGAGRRKSRESRARRVRLLTPVTRRFLAHDRVVGVQDIAPGDLRRDSKYCV